MASSSALAEKRQESEGFIRIGWTIPCLTPTVIPTPMAPTSTVDYPKNRKVRGKHDQFKITLESPLSSIKWPPLQNLTREELLRSLLTFLSSSRTNGPFPSKRKSEYARENVDDSTDSTHSVPYLLGINSVTQHLQRITSQSQTFPQSMNPIPSMRKRRSRPSRAITDPRKLSVIFVCKPDISPALLVQHLLILTASFNSSSENTDSSLSGSEGKIYLVPLGRGAEGELAKVLKVRRAAVIGVFDGEDAESMRLRESVKSLGVSPVTLPRFCRHVSTNVKALKT